MPLPEVKYAVYPGTVAVYNIDGDYIDDDTFTALELATLYGVQDEDYLTIDEGDPEPVGKLYFEYIHLKPRSDRQYINMKTQVEAVYRPDFDATKRWTEETDPNNIDKDIDGDARHDRVGYFR